MPIQVLVGYDGSPAAGAVIDSAAQLFPHAHAWIAHLWTPPFGSTSLRQRLSKDTGHINDFVAALEREGEREADRLAGTGVALARTAGWDAEPLVVRGYGGEGLHLADLAEKMHADVMLVGSRGLGGAQAVLGSTSDLAVHYTTRPVLVIPHPLLIAEHAALTGGPVMVGYDGSAGAQTALEAAARLFPTRSLLLVTVDDGHAPDDSTVPAHIDDRAVARLRVPCGHGAAGRAVAGALAASARGRDAAAVVVGSRGRSAIQEILLGSVAVATLHHTHRPVLVIPPADRKPTAEKL